MKKVILFAAAAMLAFASCNKEEGVAKLTFGGEGFTNEKEAYGSNHIYFTAGDQLNVNNVWYDVTPKNGGAQASVECPGADVYNMYYGDVNVSGNTVTTIFKSEVEAIPESFTTLGATHQVWPLSATVAASALNDGADIILRHNVAVFALGVKYGPQFAATMWGANGIVANGLNNTWSEGDDLPELKITRVELNCPSRAIAGPATLNNNTKPYFVMDANATGHTMAMNFTTPYVVSESAADSYGNRVANMAVAPIVDEVVLNVTFYFSAYVDNAWHNYSYSGSFTTDPDGTCLRRATRLDFTANLYDQDADVLSGKIHEIL